MLKGGKLFSRQFAKGGDEVLDDGGCLAVMHDGDRRATVAGQGYKNHVSRCLVAHACSDYGHAKAGGDQI